MLESQKSSSANMAWSPLNADIMEEAKGHGASECIWIPESSQSIEVAISYLFASKRQLTLRTASLGTNCTCAVVKPHAVKEKVAGEILQLLSKVVSIN